MSKGIGLITMVLVISTAMADESAIQLQDGIGKDLIIAHCSACHSLDYIQMNSGILEKAGWEKTVDKMVKAMGAPINPEEVDLVVAYLAKYYGK